MANMISPDEGLPYLLAYLLQKLPNSYPDWELMLYVSVSGGLNQGTVYADLSEVSFTGYARVTLTHSTWTTPTVVSGIATSTWGTSPVVWSNSGIISTSVLGWAIIDPTLGKIMYAQTNPGGLITMYPAGTVEVLPAISLSPIP